MITAEDQELVLAKEFAARNLIRTKPAARLLHVRRVALVAYMQQGVVPAESVTYEGLPYYGVPAAEVARLHHLMWPDCECAAEKLEAQ